TRAGHPGGSPGRVPGGIRGAPRHDDPDGPHSDTGTTRRKPAGGPSWDPAGRAATRHGPADPGQTSDPSDGRGKSNREPADTLVGMPAQYIFTMRDLRRFHPPDREVLKGINLSFYPGAKIGVIGSNGSGKSSLLRIMAGGDDGFTGEARLTPGFTVGFLAQEPVL